ncbi:MAG TPA: hypothetical protein VFW44_13595 [Bryobacteraceae bacterium]|nr:hypothetical protein [Bryobacteraceae bacterium]
MRNTVTIGITALAFAASAAAQDGMMQKLHLQMHGNLAQGAELDWAYADYKFSLNNYQQEQLYLQYEKGKLTLSFEGRLNPIHETFGSAPATYVPMRSWYGMVSYRVTNNLTVGSYYDQSWFFLQNRERSDPSNFFKEVTAGARYDVNRFFYAKLEGHYIDGNALGFYPQVNPQGFQKVTRLLAARIGFAF